VCVCVCVVVASLRRTVDDDYRVTFAERILNEKTTRVVETQKQIVSKLHEWSEIAASPCSQLRVNYVESLVMQLICTENRL